MFFRQICFTRTFKLSKFMLVFLHENIITDIDQIFMAYSILAGLKIKLIASIGLVS